MLFWDDITIIWDENILYFFNWENKKFVYLIFINKLSQNNVPKFRTKVHEQVLSLFCHFLIQHY